MPNNQTKCFTGLKLRDDGASQKDASGKIWVKCIIHDDPFDDKEKWKYAKICFYKDISINIQMWAPDEISLKIAMEAALHALNKKVEWCPEPDNPRCTQAIGWCSLYGPLRRDLPK